jgi:hypothetical protein
MRPSAGTTAWRRPWAWAFALAVLHAASDELHQGFVAGRHPSALDVAIDAGGALLALVAVGRIRSDRSRGGSGLGRSRTGQSPRGTFAASSALSRFHCGADVTVASPFTLMNCHVLRTSAEETRRATAPGRRSRYLPWAFALIAR